MDTEEQYQAGRRLREIRAGLEQLLQAREDAIRDAVAVGVAVTDVAATIGLSRTHVYRILGSAG